MTARSIASRRALGARASLAFAVCVAAAPLGFAQDLAWIDCRNMGLAPSALFDFFARQARLWLDPGTKFGNAGEGFMRINLACSRSLVDEALLRLQRALTE